MSKKKKNSEIWIRDLWHSVLTKYTTMYKCMYIVYVEGIVSHYRG